MSYELLALPVPPGAEIEEAGEALEVRLAGGHEFRDVSDAAVARRRALAAVVVGADPGLAPEESAEATGPVALHDDAGVRVVLDTGFVQFQVAYAAEAETAEELFERLFRVVSAVVRETGWRVYDPQGACGVDADDAGRDATLEIYLTVLDQIPPRNRRVPPR